MPVRARSILVVALAAVRALRLPSGADLEVVQQMLGLGTATLTLDLDGHLSPDRLDDVADRMDAVVRAHDVPYEGSTEGRCFP